MIFAWSSYDTRTQAHLSVRARVCVYRGADLKYCFLLLHLYSVNFPHVVNHCSVSLEWRAVPWLCPPWLTWCSCFAWHRDYFPFLTYGTCCSLCLLHGSGVRVGEFVPFAVTPSCCAGLLCNSQNTSCSPLPKRGAVSQECLLSEHGFSQEHVPTSRLREWRSAQTVGVTESGLSVPMPCW